MQRVYRDRVIWFKFFWDQLGWVEVYNIVVRKLLSFTHMLYLVELVCYRRSVNIFNQVIR
jgi:hypothetical protein